MSMSRQKSAEGIVVDARGNARFMAKARTFHKEEPYDSRTLATADHGETSLGDPRRSENFPGQELTAPGNEPPIADPHDGWCGGRRRKASAYLI